MQDELRTARERARRKAAIVARQEEELAVREREAGAAERDRHALGADLARARSDAEELQVSEVLSGMETTLWMLTNVTCHGAQNGKVYGLTGWE